MVEPRWCSARAPNGPRHVHIVTVAKVEESIDNWIRPIAHCPPWHSRAAAVEATKEPYLLPQEMRELTTVRNYLIRLRDAVRASSDPSPDLPAVVAAGGPDVT